MLKLLPVAAICTVIAGGAIGFKASQLIINARVQQAAYLCEAQYESACYNLAVLTKGQCSAPGGWPYGCKHDSRVTVNK